MEGAKLKKVPPPVPAKPSQKAKEKVIYADSTAENAVQNMLNEAISQMITIRNRKRDTSPESSSPREEEKTGEEKVPAAATTTTKSSVTARDTEVDFERNSGRSFLSTLDLEIPAKKSRREEGTAALDFTSATPTVIRQVSSECSCSTHS